MDPGTSHGICTLSLVPARKEPSDRSELVTQLLFGELFSVLARKEQWVCIKTTYDQYECWIDIKQCHFLYAEVFESIRDSKTAVAADLVSVLRNNETGHLFPIVAGSSLPHFRNDQLRIDKTTFTYEGEIALDVKHDREQIVESAYLYLNTPYLWGGRSPFGIDCSGFTQLVYKMNGIKIARDAYQQAEEGKALNFVEEAREGDLAFFDNKDGKIIHTGIILKNGRIIHASGKVRVDSFDHNGIFNVELEQYTHRLRIIKAFL